MPVRFVNQLTLIEDSSKQGSSCERKAGYSRLTAMATPATRMLIVGHVAAALANLNACTREVFVGTRPTTPRKGERDADAKTCSRRTDTAGAGCTQRHCTARHLQEGVGLGVVRSLPPTVDVPGQPTMQVGAPGDHAPAPEFDSAAYDSQLRIARGAWDRPRPRGLGARCRAVGRLGRSRQARTALHLSM